MIVCRSIPLLCFYYSLFITAAAAMITTYSLSKVRFRKHISIIIVMVAIRRGLVVFWSAIYSVTHLPANEEL